MERGVQTAADDTRNGSVPDAAGAPGATGVFPNVQICCFFAVLGDSDDTPA